MTPAQWTYRPGAPGEEDVIVVSDDPLVVRDSDGGRVVVSLAMRYVLLEHPHRGPWKASTRGYRYRIEVHGRELVSWHRHPGARSREERPHLHVAAGPLAGLHLPTGRVSVEGVVRLLLGEIDVQPTTAHRDDRPQVLDDAQQAFELWRTSG